MVEGGGLENRLAGNCHGGSNPSPAADRCHVIPAVVPESLRFLQEFIPVDTGTGMTYGEHYNVVDKVLFCFPI